MTKVINMIKSVQIIASPKTAEEGEKRGGNGRGWAVEGKYMSAPGAVEIWEV